MKSVWVRELKNRLSEYLREVRSGEVVLVTDRGDVVADSSRQANRPMSTVSRPGWWHSPGEDR